MCCKSHSALRARINYYIHMIVHSWFTRRGELKEKPTVVVDYNEFMLGMDKLEQLMSYYSFLHKSVKWWRKIFFWLLKVVVINAYIIHKDLARLRGERPMSHLEFCRKLILSLSEPLRTSVPHSTRTSRTERLPHFL